MRRWLLAAFLGAAALYVPRLGTPLLWDDRGVIALNDSLDRRLPLSAFFTREYFAFSGEASWRPVATASYRALTAVFGRAPAPLRLSSLLLHALAAYLLFLLARPYGETAAACAAALFALHPAHLETLLVVAFNEEPLCAVFLLLMLLAHRARRTAAACAALALALGSKETGLAGPILAWWLERSRRKPFAAYAAVCAAYAALRFGALKGPESPAPVLSLVERASLAGDSLATAARVFFVPADLRIEYFALPGSLGPLWLAVAALLAAWALSTRIARGGPRERADVWTLWPLPFLAAASPLLPVGLQATRLFAERWLYLPALGACAALALRLPPRAAAALALLWLSLGAWRARDWKSETALWESLAADAPWSAKAWEGLGEADLRAGRAQKARFELQRALDLREGRQDPVLAFYVPRAKGALAWERPSLLRWLGIADLELGRSREAARSFERAAALEPRDVFSRRALAYLAAERGDWEEALRWADDGLSTHPEDDLLRRIKADARKKKLSFRAKFS